MEKNKLLLGAHMSIAGGVEKALLEGASIGCTTIQMFTKSNRQWGAKRFTKEEIDLFLETKKTTGITSIVCHASYLINLASSDKNTAHKSITALKQELERCHELSIDYLVLHPGSAVKHDPQTALQQVAEGIDNALKESNGKVKILLETMAGQGSSLGSTLEELAVIKKAITHKSRIGFCIDTCHLFAAGYDFRTPTTYAHLWNTIDDLLGISNIHAIHMNNSKKALGSRVDRHEDIAKGEIPLEAFKLIMNDKRLFDIPKILETPKTTLYEDKKNMETLIELMSPLTRKTLAH